MSSYKCFERLARARLTWQNHEDDVPERLESLIDLFTVATRIYNWCDTKTKGVLISEMAYRSNGSLMVSVFGGCRPDRHLHRFHLKFQWGYDTSKCEYFICVQDGGLHQEGI